VLRVRLGERKGLIGRLLSGHEIIAHLVARLRRTWPLVLVKFMHGILKLVGNVAAGTNLQTEPLCRIYLEAGRVVPATVADHIESHRGDYNAFGLGQLRSLCAECHNALGDANKPRAPVRADGTPF
jgi:hypothetical protein